jgi:hypothetical protein
VHIERVLVVGTQEYQRRGKRDACGKWTLRLLLAIDEMEQMCQHSMTSAHAGECFFDDCTSVGEMEKKIAFL